MREGREGREGRKEGDGGKEGGRGGNGKERERGGRERGNCKGPLIKYSGFTRHEHA